MRRAFPPAAMRRRPTRQRRPRGISMVEFSLTIPVILGLIFGIIDFGRYSQASNTVAEAARQGARQAVPNASSSDNPFGTASGSCSGTVYAANASGSGCLTDTAIQSSVASAMTGLVQPSAITLEPDTTASACSSLAALPAGQAYLCISPADGTAGHTTTTATTSCPAGYPTPSPTPAAVTRQGEWTSNALKGCYYVTVTVVYFYRPLTPFLGSVMGTRRITSSTSMLAEY